MIWLKSTPKGFTQERLRLHRITDGDVSCHTLVQSIMSEDAISARESAFDILALFVLVVELQFGGIGETNVHAGSFGEAIGFVGVVGG